MADPAPGAMTPSLTPPNTRMTWVEKTRVLATQAFSVMQGMYTAINGLTPIIPCTCVSASNVYTLTPFPVSPQFSNYYDYVGFSFVADASSTGPVTLTVTPKTGTLPTLPVYLASGVQVNNADMTAGLFYIAYYVDTYPIGVGTGGFSLR